MNAAAALLPASTPAGPPAFDEAWAQGLLREQVEMLGRLAADGMRLAQAIVRQAVGEEACGPEPAGPPEASARPVARGDIAAAYARAARAVRMTLMLQARVIEEMRHPGARALAALGRNGGGPRPGGVRAAKAQERRDLTLRIVGRIARGEHGETEAAERLTQEAAEQLEDDDLYGDILRRPVSETLERLCQDLDLHPDWTHLAQEAWAQAEFEAGHYGDALGAARPRTNYVLDWDVAPRTDRALEPPGASP